jgi:hypothetical protein
MTKKWKDLFKNWKVLDVKNQERAAFWGPVGVAVAVTCFLNAFAVSKEHVAFSSPNGITDLVIGIICLLLALVSASRYSTKRMWSRVILTGCVSISLWWNHFISSYGNGLLWLGDILIVVIAVGIILGFAWSP